MPSLGVNCQGYSVLSRYTGSRQISKYIAKQDSAQFTIHQLFDVIDSIAVQGFDEQRRVVYWNTGSEILYGYTKEEALGKKLEDIVVFEHVRKKLVAAHNQWLKSGIRIPASEVLLRNKNGEDISVFSNTAMFTDKQNKQYMYSIDINLSDVRQAQAQAILQENMLKAVLESTPDLFFLMSEDGTIVDYHAGNTKELYVPQEQFINKRIADVLPEEVGRKFHVHIGQVMKQGDTPAFEYALNLPHGKAHFEARISHLKAHKQLVAIVRDITEQHKSAEIIRQHAYFDALTLLPNRFLSLDRLSQMLNEAQRSKEKTAVLFLDLDDFKKVNDSLGHEVGDKLLIEAAKRLTVAVRKEDTVGRLGGDEFIVLLRALSDQKSILNIADNLLRVFREPFVIDARELILTVSIGIAVYPENGDCASDLLRNADTAMYQAKALGRNSYSFFTDEMNVSMIRRFNIEEQLRGALERNEFEVYYQPKIDVKSSRVIGAEALLRWHNPSLGNVTPDEFIPVAEHTGLILLIGEYVINQALSCLKLWQTSHKSNYKIAVNLSPRQFRDKNLIQFINQALQDHDIPPTSLELEITEGVLMLGKSYIDSALEDLNKLGIQLSMDDFGTGYSSLSYLRQYSFDVLKIDRSFINGITVNKEDRDLVTATIAMAHSLGLTVIAEGVEMSEQLSLLHTLGCDCVQGYYFSQPLSVNELINFTLNEN